MKKSTTKFFLKFTLTLLARIMSVGVIRRELQESFLPVEDYFFSRIPLLPISADCALM